MIDAFFSSGIGSLWGRFHAWMESVKIAIPFPGASASESTKRTLSPSRLLIAVRPSTSTENPSSLSITFNRGMENISGGSARTLRSAGGVAFRTHEVADFGLRDCMIDKGECALLAHFARCFDQCCVCKARQRAAQTDAANADSRKLLDGKCFAFHASERIHWTRRDGFANGFDRIEAGQAGRVEDFGARIGEGAEAANRVVEIGAAMEEIFGARGEREGKRQRASGFHRSGNAFDGKREIVDRAALIAAGIFHGAADNAGGSRKTNGLRDYFRIVAEAILEISGDGQVGCVGDHATMRERLVARHRAVAAAKGEGKAGAGCRKSLEAETR